MKDLKVKKCARWVGGVRYLGQSPKKRVFLPLPLSEQIKPLCYEKIN